MTSSVTQDGDGARFEVGRGVEGCVGTKGGGWGREGGGGRTCRGLANASPFNHS